jgi:hypothetical protein
MVQIYALGSKRYQPLAQTSNPSFGQAAGCWKNTTIGRQFQAHVRNVGKTVNIYQIPALLFSLGGKLPSPDNRHFAPLGSPSNAWEAGPEVRHPLLSLLVPEEQKAASIPAVSYFTFLSACSTHGSGQISKKTEAWSGWEIRPLTNTVPFRLMVRHANLLAPGFDWLFAHSLQCSIEYLAG